jgi:hypothetical protein
MKTIRSFHETIQIFKRKTAAVYAFRGLVLAAGALALAPLAFASTTGLPAAVYSGSGLGFFQDPLGRSDSSGNDGYQQITRPGSYSAGYPSFEGASFSVSTSVSALPTPSVSGSLSVQPSPYSYSQSAVSATQQVNLFYYIEFTGPAGTVPIQVNASLGGTATGGRANSEAMFYLVDQNQNGFSDEVVVSPSGGYTVLRNVQTNLQAGTSTASVADNLVWTAQTNTVYGIGLSESTNTPGLATVAESASAFADPTFQIASSVADPQDYSVLISDGIGNSAAPEPASYALFLSGVGALGWLARCRKAIAYL